MKKNMGVIDRSIRTLLVLAVAVLYFTGHITGVAAVILGIIAVVFLVTTFVGFCPLYALLGISTIKKGE